MTEQVSYTQIKSHRSGERLWIEGAKLVTAGFTRGQRYNRVVDEANQKIDLFLHPEGQFVVSGRERNGVQIPIIDMALGKYHGFPDGTRIRAVFQNGQINIRVHHEDAAKARREERLKNHMATGELKEASACTGGAISTSAIHHAISDAGVHSQVAWVVDCELKYLQSAFEHSFAINDATVFYEATLEELETHFLTEVDIFSFSLPCSGFSKSGKSKHGLSPEEHEGGTSLFGIMNIIRAANPAIIMSENVREAQGSPMYILMLQELKRRGYNIVEAVLSAADTGTFENRQRYWFVAYSNGLPVEVFESALQVHGERQYHQLFELMDETVPDDMWADNQYLKDKQVRDAAAGKGFASRQLLTGFETKIGTIGRHYNKRRSTEPFIVNDMGQERLLTLAEHARCKSIPESLVERCNATTGHEILGQSIDYLQAYLPIKKIMDKLVSWLIPRKEIAA